VKEDETGFRCSKCGSSFVYIRRKDKKLLCRKCGNIENIKIEEDNN
jgi:exosome complex RNA-binding protein Csl4